MSDQENEKKPELTPAPKKPVKKTVIRDWTPLGQVRDYFYEQLKQDDHLR